jgi:hypothetical protein
LIEVLGILEENNKAYTGADPGFQVRGAHLKILQSHKKTVQVVKLKINVIKPHSKVALRSRMDFCC